MASGGLEARNGGLDGTKVHAKPAGTAPLYEYAGKIEARLRAEVADLMARAEAADQADLPDGPRPLRRRFGSIRVWRDGL
jgi:hypothetical protein